nr:vinorine synthase [Quercus suber]
MTKEKLVLKRFVFSSASIEALKAKYVESSGLEYPVYPSRVVALLAFIWSRYVVATDQLKSKIERLHIILHAVNLRTRMDPPLSDYSFGNLFQVTITIASKETSREDCEHLDILKELSGKIMTQDNVILNFTALCGDMTLTLGGERLFLVGWVSLPFKNLITFSDSKLGDGTEAWINLNAEDMVNFECDKKLLAYATTSSGFNVKELLVART